jgi:C-terminal processing protease CtpA/Prc
MLRRVLFFAAVAALMSVFVLPAWAIGEVEPQPAPDAAIINDEGGPVLLEGQLEFTLGFFTTLWREPYVLMYDMTGYIDDDEDFIAPPESQILGTVTSDPTQSPISYELRLPARPNGQLRDVDQDGNIDAGVMTFELLILDNVYSDPFAQERDTLAGYPSLVFSDDAVNYGDIIGGRMVVWSPDDRQGFPSGFGEDGELFTADDPIVSIPQGYTIVDFDEEPFTFDRAETGSVDLLESEGNRQDDFSDLSYTEAFDAAIEKMRREYAFTELKDIDWDALKAEFMPQMEQAEADEDSQAYQRVLRDFAWSIPDGHMSAPISVQEFRFATDGGLGIAVREVDDGRVIVNYLLDGSPADEAGIQMRAEILQINGEDVQTVIDNTVPWSAPFSTDHVLRLQQLRYIVRFPVETDVEITYRNPDSDLTRTATMTTVAERESFTFSSFNQGRDGDELPVEFELRDDGYGYVKIWSFSDDLPLTLDLWKRALATFRANQVPGIIIDMRQNGGGFTSFGYQMMAYFFNEELEIEIESVYDDSIEDFWINEEDGYETFDLPPENERYNGELAVLVGPSCSSACEFVVRSLTLDDRAAIVGQYPTGGLAGGWQPFFMPDDVQLPIIRVRTFDPEGNIVIEGTGVEPTIEVPVNEETLFSDGDPILEAAVTHLDELTALDTLDGGTVAIGESLTGELAPRQRIRYELQVSEGDVISIFADADDPDTLDTVLRLYFPGSEDVIAANDDASDETTNAALQAIEIPQDFTLLVEVGSFEDEGSGAFELRIENAAE